jgi:hypothetical protein
VIYFTRDSRETNGWEFDADRRLARMYWGPSPLPPRLHLAGTIRRPDGRTGALIQYNRTGIYIQGNAGCTTSLDQEAVNDLVREAGELVG